MTKFQEAIKEKRIKLEGVKRDLEALRDEAYQAGDLASRDEMAQVIMHIHDAIGAAREAEVDAGSGG